jgi:hypothetical protein
MVIHDFYIVGTIIHPNKADAKSTGHRDRVLTFAISGQSVQAIAARQLEIVQFNRVVQKAQLAVGRGLDVDQNAGRSFATVEKCLSLFAGEALDHEK